MAYQKPDMFKWKRKVQPLKKSGTKNNMKDWIKRIQSTSDDAVREAFGSNILEEDIAKEIIADDEAIYEAQELLDGWMKEKTFPDLDKELHYKGENWSSSTGVMLKAESYLNSNSRSCTVYDELKSKYLGNDVTSDSTYASRGVEDDPFVAHHLLSLHDDEDIDEALLVQDVLHGMLTKDVSANIDLGMKPLVKTVKDPLPKMNMRHEQVKQRAELRRIANASRRDEKMSKEEIEQKARQRIVLEERERIKREWQQEKDIATEMEKIKKELAEEKLRRDEDKERKKRIFEEAKSQMQSELQKQKEEEIRRKKQEEEFRLEIQKEAEKEAIEEMKQYMHIMQKHFSAWYTIVLERRASMGKVQAIADWKCKLKAWDAWKAYVACVKSSQQVQEAVHSAKEKYRKEKMAVQHHYKNLQRRCFHSLLKYAHYRVNKKHLQREHEEKSKKMALFLEVASTGELWQKKNVHLEALKPIEKERMGHQEEKEQTKEKLQDRLSQECVVEEPERNEKFKKKILREKTLPVKMKVSTKTFHSESRYVKEENETDCFENGSNNKLVDAKDTTKRMKKGRQILANGMKFKDDHELHRASHEIEKEEEIRVQDHAHSTVLNNTSKPSEQQSKKKKTKPIRLAMEERENRRLELKAVIEKEKQKKEEKRLEELRAKEAERLLQEQLEKQEKVRIRRDQKRLQVQLQKEKELRLEQIRLKNEMATHHYHLVLMQKFGLEPLKRIVQISKLSIEISDKYRSSLLLRLTVMKWHEYVKNLSTTKRQKADHCYQRILLKRSLHSWRKCRFYLEKMNKIAREYSMQRRLKRAFSGWQDYVTDERILMWAKESTADEHSERRVVNNCFKFWMRFVKLQQEEKIREVRKEEFRKKVQLWLPDYKGGSRSASP